MRTTVFIATSIDGHIARADGSLDWLPGADPHADDGPDLPDDAFAAVADCDVLVLGRASYDAVLAFDVGWPYDVPAVVLSHRPLDAPPDGADVRRFDGEITTLWDGLRAAGHDHVWVDGGAVIQQALAADLVDTLCLTVAPTLLGDGVRLFGDLPTDRSFAATASRVLPGGMVQTTWQRAR